jgi:hypothetical protein
MEQIDAPLLKDYSPLKLYLNDLERLEQVLAESCSEATCDTEGFRFGSIAELASNVKKTRLDAIRIEGNSPRASVELRKRWARIYVSSSKAQGAGMFYKLDQILSASQRSPRWLYSYSFVWVLNVLIYSWGVLSFRIHDRLTRLVGVVVSGVLFIAWFAWVFRIRMTRHSTIILKRRAEQGSFVERNKDELAVAVIAATLGALLGVAGTIWATHFTK